MKLKFAQKGSAQVEYIFISALVSVVAIAVVTNIGTEIDSVLSSVNTTLADSLEGATGGDGATDLPLVPTSIFVYDVSEVSIYDVSRGAPPDGNPITFLENGMPLHDQMTWPFEGMEITIGTETTEINFVDSDGILSEDPISDDNVAEQMLNSDLTIAGETFYSNYETVLWEDAPEPIYVQHEYETTVTDTDGVEYTMFAISIVEGYAFTIVAIAFEGLQPTPGATLTYAYATEITNFTSAAIPGW